jgi:hypothetical protein
MPNTYTLLETITVGAANASSVTFNSIPQTGYTDLVIKASVRSTIAEDAFGLRFNSDTGSNYNYRVIGGQGASASSFSGNSSMMVAMGRQSESGYTANTFGNTEIYIPNYTSANQKSVSSDAVNENNATTARAQLAAGLWTGTAAITTVQVVPGAGSFAQFSTFSLYGVSALGTTPTKAPKATGGSIIQTDGTYWYHAFLSSGTFTPATALSCDILTIAGGGSGGPIGGAGGGAGGLVYLSSQSVGTSAQTVTVGGGGAGVSGSFIRGNSGTNSQFALLTAAVGGGAGGGDSVAVQSGLTGGSGGGSIAQSVGTTAGAAGTSGQGNAGGSGSTDNVTYRSAGGGGGAGAVGGNGNTASPAISGAGGAGVTTYSSWGSVTGTGENISGTYWFAGGGGGANGTSGAKGNGGGSAGVNAGSSAAGLANSGGGSGGCGGTGNSTGNGGSGIVIVRYLA